MSGILVKFGCQAHPCTNINLPAQT